MEKILKEEIIDVRGTTKLTVGDPMYLDAIADGTDRGCEKELVFDGSISGAPLGKLRIREIHCIENGLECDVVDVSVFQASQPFMFNVYLDENTTTEQSSKISISDAILHALRFARNSGQINSIPVQMVIMDISTNTNSTLAWN